MACQPISTNMGLAINGVPSTSGSFLCIVDWLRHFLKCAKGIQLRVVPTEAVYDGKSIHNCSGAYPKGVLRGALVGMCHDIRVAFARFLFKHPSLGRGAKGWDISLGIS